MSIKASSTIKLEGEAFGLGAADANKLWPSAEKRIKGIGLSEAEKNTVRTCVRSWCCEDESDVLRWFCYAISQVALSIFGCSDWQKARNALKDCLIDSWPSSPEVSGMASRAYERAEQILNVCVDCHQHRREEANL